MQEGQPSTSFPKPRTPLTGFLEKTGPPCKHPSGSHAVCGHGGVHIAGKAGEFVVIEVALRRKGHVNVSINVSKGTDSSRLGFLLAALSHPKKCLTKNIRNTFLLHPRVLHREVLIHHGLFHEQKQLTASKGANLTHHIISAQWIFMGKTRGSRFVWLVEVKGIGTLPQNKVETRVESTGQLGILNAIPNKNGALSGGRKKGVPLLVDPPGNDLQHPRAPVGFNAGPCNLCSTV